MDQKVTYILLSIFGIVITGVAIYFIWRHLGSPKPDPKDLVGLPGIGSPNNVGVGVPNGQLFVQNMTLTPGEEVPTPVNAQNSIGTGQVYLLDNELRYSFDIPRLSTPLTMAHFHRAPRGVAGPIVRDIQFMQNQNGVYVAQGTWNPSADVLNQLRRGEIYVNVHTSQNPAGEIRAQVELRPQ